MRLSKHDLKEKAARKNESVKKLTTRRQLNRQTAQTSLKAEKMAAKDAAWEASKDEDAEYAWRSFQLAMRRAMRRKAHHNALVMQGWEAESYHLRSQFF
jgi:hypothetical protein